MSLRVCSLEARGLWIEMLAIMGISEKYGHLQLGGQPITAKQLGVMAGCSEQDADRLVKELEANNVFSRDDAGVPYCRRMVREIDEYEQHAEYGRYGGNPALTQKQEARSKKLEARSYSGLKPPLKAPLKANENSISPWTPTQTMLRIGSWFRRKPTTPWSAKEIKALSVLGDPPPEIETIERWYSATITGQDFRRKDILTLLNNWPGEIDRANGRMNKPAYTGPNI